jgi:tRNA uridine 5-carboxymethylaminomethyl modification enzyme
MFTSCAEYRLVLRQDNADLRLGKYGHKLGLLESDIMQRINKKEQLMSEGIKYLKSLQLQPKDINEFLTSINSPATEQPQSAVQILKRNEVKLDELMESEYFKDNPLIEKLRGNPDAINQIDIETKYEGYIKRQNEQAENFNNYETVEIPEKFDFNKIKSLSTEGREKLNKVRPRSLGQASRISGVSPSDTSILTVYLKG